MKGMKEMKQWTVFFVIDYAQCLNIYRGLYQTLTMCFQLDKTP